MNIHRMIYRIPRWTATALTVAAILYATLASKPVGADKLPLFPGVDKVVHFIMFATLAAALLFDVGRTEKATTARHMMAIAAVAAICFGAVDELLQATLTANRSGDPLDWLADCAGAVVAVLTFAAWRRLRRPRVHRPACRD